nr:MAG TPA: hypothetical protein [Caudoviricetes sp.]
MSVITGLCSPIVHFYSVQGKAGSVKSLPGR